MPVNPNPAPRRYISVEKTMKVSNDITQVGIQKKGFTNMTISIKRSILAVRQAMTFCAMLPLFTGVHASSGVDPQIAVVPPNNCVDLGLFAFPVAPKQGDTVTVF